MYSRHEDANRRKGILMRTWHQRVRRGDTIMCISAGGVYLDLDRVICSVGVCTFLFTIVFTFSVVYLFAVF